jgi:hypothetical protein
MGLGSVCCSKKIKDKSIFKRNKTKFFANQTKSVLLIFGMKIILGWLKHCKRSSFIFTSGNIDLKNKKPSVFGTRQITSWDGILSEISERFITKFYMAVSGFVVVIFSHINWLWTQLANDDCCCSRFKPNLPKTRNTFAKWGKTVVYGWVLEFVNPEKKTLFEEISYCCWNFQTTIVIRSMLKRGGSLITANIIWLRCFCWTTDKYSQGWRQSNKRIKTNMLSAG